MTTMYSEQASAFASRPDPAWHVKEIHAAFSAYHMECLLNPHQARELAAVLRAKLRESTETAEQQERSR